MGLILDSSVLITAEREGQNARQMLTAISGAAGDAEIAISVVTLIELAHGAARADTLQRKAKRHQFIQELLTALPIHPITVLIALRTGQIDGENQAKGVRLPLSDLLIGVTALELGYSVATANFGRECESTPKPITQQCRLCSSNDSVNSTGDHFPVPMR
jgi:predicted nucleic acid-binding protein